MVGMSGHYDVIIIGAGGAMGSATCFELARRKVRVLGLDQFGIAHDRGSSHGHSRMIRLAYYEHPDYVPLLRRAYDRWREIEQISGQRLLEITGGIYAGFEGCELVRQSHASAVQHGIEHELLDRNEVAHRFPQFRLPDDHVGLFEPAAGFLFPERAIAAYAKHAMIGGAEIHGHEPVRAWSENSVTTDVATYACDRIIFCGGAWTAKLLRDLGIELSVTRQALGWVWPPRHEEFALGRFICWAMQQADGSLYYGFPMGADEPGLKMAHHKPGPAADPDALQREPTLEDAQAIERIVDDVLPSARGPIVSMRICMYTNSPDSHFIIGRHPQRESAVIACGFSGHGFKFASVVGEILADLATSGATQWPIGFFSPQRFAKPQ